MCIRDRIYVLTNSEKLKHEEYKYEQMEMDGLFLSDVLETLTPSRKKVAYAAIELYKRLKEGQVENPAVLSSGNVCKMMHPVLCDITTEEMWVPVSYTHLGSNSSAPIPRLPT